MFDFHIHTQYSHGTSEVFEMIEHAIKKGLTNIGFVEHFPYDFFGDTELPRVDGKIVSGTSLERFKLYYQAVERAKDFYRDKIKITLGVEIDYLENREEELRQALEISPCNNGREGKEEGSKFEFDFIMGAVHFIGIPPRYFSDYKHRSDDWFIDKYFMKIKKCIKSGLFDIVAHPELIKYYINKKKEGDYKYRRHLEEVVDLLARYNMAVDVNTDYIRGSEGHKLIKERVNPGLTMLKMCRDKNIPLVLGSDAHRPEKIANNFKETIRMIKGMGINRLYYFKNRKLVSCDI